MCSVRSCRSLVPDFHSTTSRWNSFLCLCVSGICFNSFQLLRVLLLLLVSLCHLCRCHRNCVVRLERKHTRFAVAFDDIFGRFIFPPLLKFAFSWFCIGEVICCWWLASSKWVSKCFVYVSKKNQICTFSIQYSLFIHLKKSKTNNYQLIEKERKKCTQYWHWHNSICVCPNCAHTFQLFDCCLPFFVCFHQQNHHHLFYRSIKSTKFDRNCEIIWN